MARIEITRYYNHKSTSPNLIHKNIRETIVKVAKKYIPRGEVNKHKPFWTKQLQILKKERDQARKRNTQNSR